MKYQVMVLGPRSARRLGAFKKEFRASLRDLGMDSRKDCQFLSGRKAADLNWNGSPVGVWFGAPEAATDADEGALRKLLAEDCIVFPVVDSLKDYTRQVPRELYAVNGMEWDAPRLTAEMLRAFGLTREQRQAFISYKRDESSAAAAQLFDLLSHRGYRVFLDTFAVGPADLFQEALWGEMADVDLLIFLDTANALTSRWVYQELARANDLGLGVLQILWPGLKRMPGTEFSDLVKLRMASFQGGVSDASGRLKETSLNRVLSYAERARIRSLKSRRDRVVSDLIDQARGHQLEAVVHPTGSIELRRSSRKVATAIPLVGVPDAATIEHQERKLARSERRTSRVIYDGLGVRPKWLSHLDWLNCPHRLNTSQITAADDWLEGL